jgi:hypothetical protein
MEAHFVLWDTNWNFKVKCTLIQALRFCTGRRAHRGSRGIALLFHGQHHLKGVRGQRHAPAALYPRKRPGTHCIGGWVSPRAVLDRCGKFRPHWDSIPGLPSSLPVAIPTELSQPTLLYTNYSKIKASFTATVVSHRVHNFCAQFFCLMIRRPPRSTH